MYNEFIPVVAYDQRTKKYFEWYLDISNMTMSELIKLRKELNGTSQKSVRIIDKAVNDGIIYKCCINKNVGYKQNKKDKLNEYQRKKFGKTRKK